MGRPRAGTGGTLPRRRPETVHLPVPTGRRRDLPPRRGRARRERPPLPRDELPFRTPHPRLRERHLRHGIRGRPGRALGGRERAARAAPRTGRRRSARACPLPRDTRAPGEERRGGARGRRKRRRRGRLRGREGHDPGGPGRGESPPLALLCRGLPGRGGPPRLQRRDRPLPGRLPRCGNPGRTRRRRQLLQARGDGAVVAALRAVDDPSDSVATVAALKSFLFGLTDVELLDASEAGTRFDEPATAPAEGPVAAALACLGSLRARRLHRPLAETLLDLLTTRRVLAAVENGAVVNGLQASANLDRLLVLARALDAEGLPFREAVARLGLRLEEKVPEPRAFEEDDDAVRLLTLHKAKGLEFDTVVVAGLGFRDREKVASRRSLFYDRAGRHLALRLPVAGLVVGTPGLRFVAAADELRLRAEEKRLLYVALTRAKKNLVLSWFRRRRTLKSGDVSDPIGKSLLRPIAFAEGLPARLAPLVEVVSPDVSIPPAPAVTAPLDAAVDLSAVMAAAEARLERARATASRPLRRSGEKDGLWRPGASPGPASPEDLPSIERSEEVQARAVRLGSAVHEAMELLLDPERVPPSSAEDAVAATSPALDPAGVAEAVSLVDRLLAHPVVARARVSRRRFVELPVLFRDEAFEGSPLVEGKIDLLFEEGDGWVVVDWKTDRISTAAARTEREALYTPQLASYARALSAVLGPGTIVKEMVLAFARG
ncbi:MAG: PD-(D/E)XK nuclease family protein [Holophagales bacterium]|nr:PD-(D/E)XK nuclease family protein [Holophagales bacterium]